MAPKQNKSPVVAIALILSVVAGIVIAFAMLWPDGSNHAAANEKIKSSSQKSSTATRATATPASPSPTPAASPALASMRAASSAASTTPTLTPHPTATQTPAPTATPATLVLKGTVSDADGAPVAGAQIYLVPRVEGRIADVVKAAFRRSDTHSIITADSTGAYAVSIPVGRAFVAGLMISGEPQLIAQEISPATDAASVEANFTMPRPFELRGIVADAAVKPIPDITLKIEWIPSTLRGAMPTSNTITVQTDSDGRYSTTFLSPQTISATVDASSLPAPYLYERPPVILTPADFRDSRSFRYDFALITGIPVDGIVSARQPSSNAGAQEPPVEGARVSIREILGADAQRVPREFVEKTAPDGSFHFGPLAPRDYLITVHHPDFSPRQIRDYDPSKATEPLAISIAPLATVRGTITGPPNASAKVWLADRYKDKEANTTFDGDGKATFEFAKIASGAYLVMAETKGEDTWYAERKLLVGERPEVTAGVLEMKKLAEIRGQFLDAQVVDARTISVDARLEAPPDPDNLLEITAPGKRRRPIASASESGTFAVENTLSGENYVVEAKDRRSGTVLGSAVVTAGGADIVKIALGGVGTVQGSVRSVKGRACVGVQLVLFTGLGSLEGTRGVPQTWRTTVDYDGNYLFKNVPAGQARLRIEGEEDSNRLLSIPHDNSVTIDMNCRTYVDVTFQIVGNPAQKFAPHEQFIVVAKPGYVVKTRVHEMTLESLSATLEPAVYVLTRSSTMESREFEIQPESSGIVKIDFSAPAEEAKAASK